MRKYIDAIASIEADIENLKQQVPFEEAAAPAPAPAEEAAAPAASVTCPQCGAEVEADALFCNGCGAQL